MQPSAHVRVPEYWRSMAATINADPSPGKVLKLPLDDYYQMPTRWGLLRRRQHRQPAHQTRVVQPKPDGYFGDVPGCKADITGIQTALLSGDLTAVPACSGCQWHRQDHRPSRSHPGHARPQHRRRRRAHEGTGNAPRG